MKGPVLEDLSRSHRPKTSSNRSFGLVMAGAFAIASAVLIWRGRTWFWTAGIAAAFAILAMAAPSLLAPLNRVWTVVGLVLHKVVSPLVLGVVFYAVVAPVGLLMRLARKDSLSLKLDPAAVSYWVSRVPGARPNSMKDQF